MNHFLFRIFLLFILALMMNGCTINHLAKNHKQTIILGFGIVDVSSNQNQPVITSTALGIGFHTSPFPTFHLGFASQTSCLLEEPKPPEHFFDTTQRIRNQ